MSEQDYNQHVWDKVDLPHPAAVQAYSLQFFDAYRHSPHHSALHGQTPAELQHAHPARRLPDNLRLPAHLPVTVGKVHFIRRVDAQRAIHLLNVEWLVVSAQPDQGVWATLHFTLHGATLSVFDAAHGITRRRYLAVHPFPLSEPVLPLQACFRHSPVPQPSLIALTARSLHWLATTFRWLIWLLRCYLFHDVLKDETHMIIL